MKNTLFIVVLFTSLLSHGQLKENTKVLLTFENTPEETNVDSSNAVQMLKSYIQNKTNCIVSSNKEEAEFVLTIQIIEKNMGDRKGKMTVTDLKTNKIIFTTKWVRGTMNAFYGYSGSRHAIGRLVKKKLMKEYPEIVKQN